MGELADALSLDGGVISLVGGGGKTTFMFRLAREASQAGQTVLATTTTKIFVPTPDQSPICLLAKGAPELIRRWNALSPPSLFATAAASLSADRRKLIGFSPDIIDRIADAGLFRWIIVEADGAARRPLKAPAPHEPVVPRCTDAVIALVGLDALGKPLYGDHVFRSETYARLTGLNMGEPVTAASVAALLSHPEGLFKGTPKSSRKIVFLNKAENKAQRTAGLAVTRRLTETDPIWRGRVVTGSLHSRPMNISCPDGRNAG